MRRFKLVVMKNGPSFLVSEGPIDRASFERLDEVLGQDKIIVLSDTEVLDGEGPVILDVEVAE